MKRHLLNLAVLFGVLALAAQAGAALIITPGTDTPLTGNQSSQDLISAAILGTLGSSVELYKQDVDTGESGALASSYVTEFFNTPTDPSGATITYVGGDIVGPVAFLLVKDGAQTPAWYLYNLTNLGWTGVEDLELSGFWPNQGAISHVTLYGTTPVPEAGALLMFGTGLVGLVGYRRVRRMQ